MNTFTNTAASTTATGVATIPILAIDLGKFKSVACAYDPATASWQMATVASEREEFVRLLERFRPSVVVIEACALCGWVRDLCVERGVACKVANTSAEAWKFKHTKRKTDKDDALRLAQLEALGQLPTVMIPPKATREWRALIAFRQTLVSRRNAVQNRIRSILVGQGLLAPRGHRAWTEVGRAGIGQLARLLAECGPEELWRGMLALCLTDYQQISVLLAQAETRLDEMGRASADVQRLQTAGGVGPRTAEAVVAYLHEPKRFQTGKQVSAYAGMVPRQYQSGETDHRGRISKRGPAFVYPKRLPTPFLPPPTARPGRHFSFSLLSAPSGWADTSNSYSVNLLPPLGVTNSWVL